MKSLYKKYGIYFLVIAIVSELILPFVLSGMYSDFDHITMLISEFGNANDITRIVFRFWMLINGLLFIASAYPVYQKFKGISLGYSTILSLAIILFGLGDCILTAFFETSATGHPQTLPEHIHDIGSAIGFASLLIGVVVLMILYNRLYEKNRCVDWCSVSDIVIFHVTLFHETNTNT